MAFIYCLSLVRISAERNAYKGLLFLGRRDAHVIYRALGSEMALSCVPEIRHAMTEINRRRHDSEYRLW